MMRGKAALLSNLKARGAGTEGHVCAYSHRSCTQRRLDGYEFCMKHILEDKNSPYKQCTYTAPRTNRRCSNAAPKFDRSDRKDGRFCSEHHKRMVISRQRARRLRRPKETAETLLGELAASNNTALDTSADAKRLRRSDSMASKALEYASSSDSDMETPSVDQAWRRDNDSEAESIDSDQEDPLKHAGVYSQEEAALLLRDKLIRLQSLYIEQFKRLQHVLREKRRKFLHTYKQEREKLGPIQAYRQESSQRRKYERLQSMKRYHKFFGKEALLHQKCNNRRIAVAEGVNHRPPTFSRCIAATPDGRCNKRVVPASKFCMGHILKDPHQVLFEPCAFRNGQCREAVFSLDEVSVCRRHYAAAAAPSFTASASQTEDPTEVKKELADTETPADRPTTTSSHEPMATESNSYPALSTNQALGFLSPESHFDQDVTMATESGGLGGSVGGEDRLNSSGEGNLDIGDLDLSMGPDELIRLVDAELFQ
ncbi:KAT8 regulatory NSL complex subunit 2-like [Littorina saxatilis]|uniref:KAT8 regulatory NSL complex subunit 2 n=1 Tax=Littorina saxatilis TaxID=31220 RepID=A0AAN9ATK1_9CAEN